MAKSSLVITGPGDKEKGIHYKLTQSSLDITGPGMEKGIDYKFTRSLFITGPGEKERGVKLVQVQTNTHDQSCEAI